MKKLLFGIIAYWLVIACSEKKSEVVFDKSEAVAMGMEGTSAEEAKTTSDSPPPPLPSTPQAQKKIIHTATLRFKVNDLKKAEIALKTQIQAIGGYIANANQNRQSGNLENNWTVRVPATKFDTFIGNVEKESIYTDSKNIAAEDVTAEYVDNDLRIKAKQKVFERYLELLKQAKNVQDIMAVEEQIRIIREEIESKEGRQKYLNDQVDFSTVTLNFYQETDVSSAPEQPFYVRIWHNFTDGWASFFNMIIGLFYLIPYILLIFVIIYLLRKWWKKRQP
ncbi:MAG: DUF4349 domain-containing protein [Arcicella sp.]|nr:DUF4349 domain-containing protein [Arcicella sp.]